MTIVCRDYTETIDSQITSSWASGYRRLGDPVRLGGICQAENISETKSVSAVVPPEGDLNPYECLRSSRGLAFWDRPEEDVYSFEDGQPA